MVYVPRWQPWLVSSALLLALLSSTPAQTPPAAGKPKVDRLVMGLITPYPVV